MIRTLPDGTIIVPDIAVVGMFEWAAELGWEQARDLLRAYDEQARLAFAMQYAHLPIEGRCKPIPTVEVESFQSALPATASVRSRRNAPAGPSLRRAWCRAKRAGSSVPRSRSVWLPRSGRLGSCIDSC